MTGSIRTKVLREILFTSLGALVVLGIITIVSIFDISGIVLVESNNLGETAARDSRSAQEVQAHQQLMSLAEDKSSLVDVNLMAIQRQTITVAEIATHIYTNKSLYTPRLIDYLQPSQAGTAIPHIRTASGVSLDSIQSEVYLAANIEDALRQISVVDIGLTASYIGGESGYFIVVEEHAADVMDTTYDARTRSWYLGAKDKDGIFWTDVFTDASTKSAGISCAMPYYDLSDGGRVFKGVAASGTLLSENVNKIITSTKIGETGYAFLLNEKGQIILSPKSSDFVTNESGDILGMDYLNSPDAQIRELADRMTNGERGLMSLNIDDQPVYISYHPLSALNWSLGVVVPVAEIIAPAQHIQQAIMTLTGNATARINRSIIVITITVLSVIVLAALVTFLVAARLSNSLTAPIVTLTDDVLHIGDNNLNYQSKIKTGDEIEELSLSFEHMTKELVSYIDNLGRVTAEKERIGAELDVATKIQASMLPSIFPAFPDAEEFDIYASMLPAKEVGGDFYDFFFVNKDTLAVLIADVSGKGVPAALFMVIAKTLIKSNAQENKSPKEVFDQVNSMLCETNGEDLFVTAFMGYLDIPTGKFTYVNAGHNPPLIKQGDDFKWLKAPPGFVLAAMEDMVYKQQETVLDKDDVFFLYTDGVTEATNRKEELFSDAKLLECANKHKNSGIKEFAISIKAEIDQFANGAEQADDITMLVLQYKGVADKGELNVKELNIEAKLENLDEVLAFVEAELEAQNCPMKILNQINIAVEEIFVNIARYAYNPVTGGANIRIALKGDELSIEFEDMGKPFNPLDIADPDTTASVEERDIGGLGIFMTKKLMDTVEYRREGNNNILILKKLIK